MIDPTGAAAASHTHKHLQHKVLDVEKWVRVTIKLWIVPAYVSLWISYFLFEQIGFIQKQYDWNAFEGVVIHNRIEYVLRFLQAIGSSAKDMDY